ncbi:MAG: potassium-transporting ATPase subunit F [Cyanobacteria bacterium RI_101]|nr:potassium-transporting ATPase subunit F [Cyanobacteria bacterium RI_101]
MKTPSALLPRRLTFKNIAFYFGVLFLLNLAFAPWVEASAGAGLSRGQIYALTGLGLVALSLFVYLFLVILQPEKF